MTKEEAIKAIEEYLDTADEAGHVFPIEFLTALDVAISALKDEWIPVSKRLPEVGHVVYCQLADGSHEILFLDDYPDGQMTWVGRRIRDYKVTAWREMPEPYKKGE